MNKRPVSLFLGLLLLSAVAGRAQAQELEPRSYSAAPVGSNFLVSAYTNSSGELLFGASSPITDASAEVNTAILLYNRVFGLAGRQSGFAIALPYAWGRASGNVGETGRREVSRSGLADVRVRFSTLLAGGPALTPREFAARKPGPVVGASVVAIVPTGQYVSERLINIGANRWALKPELGASVPMGKWQFDAYASVWLFGDNEEFRGLKKTQDPLASVQAHVSYTFKPRLWAAVDATYYSGGTTSVQGVGDANRQDNLRIGATVSVPVARRQSLQFTYSRGAITRIGGDFSTFGVALQTMWF